MSRYIFAHFVDSVSTNTKQSCAERAAAPGRHGPRGPGVSGATACMLLILLCKKSSVVVNLNDW